MSEVLLCNGCSDTLFDLRESLVNLNCLEADDSDYVKTFQLLRN